MAPRPRPPAAFFGGGALHRSVAQADSSFYGLGEHKDNKLERSQNGGYKKLFADSIFYGKSQGGVVIFIFLFSTSA